MKCYKCGKGIDDGVEVMLPIDPKGTPDRRWACVECVEDSAVVKIAKEGCRNEITNNETRVH